MTLAGMGDEYDDSFEEAHGLDEAEQLVYGFDGSQGPVPRRAVTNISPTQESIDELHRNMRRAAQRLFGVDRIPPDIWTKGTVTGRFVSEHPPIYEICNFHQVRVDMCACNNKEKNMGMSRKEIVARMLKKLEAELVELDKLPEEPTVPNSPFPPVIYFVKKFPGSEQEYSYVFHKAPHNGRWYGSGAKQRLISHTWDELIDWLNNSGPMPVIYKLAGYEEYWAPEEDED